MEPGRIIILGASGQIGGAMFRQLKADFPDAELLPVARKSNNFAFDPFSDDWSRLGQADLLINAIGIIREKGEMTFRKVHSGLAQLMLRHRETLGNPRILHFSALGADPRHETGFLRSKGIADEIIAAEADTVILRPSVVCTPKALIAEKLRLFNQMASATMGRIFVPKGMLSSRLQPVLLNDLTAIASASIRNDIAGIREIGGPEAMTFNEILRLLMQANGRKYKVLEVPQQMIDNFVRYFVATWLPGLINYDQFRLLFQDNITDPAFAGELLGRAPESTRDWWLAHLRER